jgi:putative iron-dependent peroxidase
MSAQTGIYALGTPEHCFVELDLLPGADDQAAEALVRVCAGLTGPLTTIGGVNVVVGFRPELWARLAPAEAPTSAASFNEDLVGPDGFTMPATQHDAWIWIAGGTRSAIFDLTRAALALLEKIATVATETTGWVYQHDRDLTGFIDGTENPKILAAPAAVEVPAGQPGAGSSVLLFQLWTHDSVWSSLDERTQELTIGRTKNDSTELSEEEMPADSHVSRTVLEVDGEELPIFRRNVAYGGPTAHGTVFVGFSLDRFRLHEMLRRMTGITDGIRCALTRYTAPVTGAYYTIPSTVALLAYAPEDDED